MSDQMSAPRAASDLDRALGNAIRLRRQMLDVTQEQLAAACEISFQQVQKYEKGVNRVSFSRLVQIARALKCTVSELTSVLDQPQDAQSDFEFLRLMTLPGARDLLDHYEALPRESRILLVDLLASIRSVKDRGAEQGAD